MKNIFYKTVKLNKAIVLNVLSSAVLQGITFFTMPIFTRILGSEQYGKYSVFHSWVSILAIIVSLSVGNSIGPGKYQFKDEYYNFRNNVICINLIISFIITLIFVLCYNFLAVIMMYNFKMFCILLLSSISVNFVTLISNILIFEKRTIANFLLSVFLSISTVILSLVIIYYMGNTDYNDLYLGRVFGNLIPYLLIFVLLFFYFIFRMRFKFDFRFFRYAFVVGFPILFHQLAHMILGQSDRVMMQKMNIANSEIGIYSLYYSFCGVLTIILSAFNTSFTPFYADYIDQNDKASIIRKTNNYIELFTIICIGFLLLSREVITILFDAEYYCGINLIPILVGATYFVFMYQFAINYEFFFRQTKTIAGGTIGAAIINVIMNLYFINAYGMFGAAIATTISYVILCVFHYIFAITMKEKRFYISLYSAFVGIVFVIVFSFLFYILQNRVYLRWLIGLFLGIIELYRMYKRRGIF